MNHEVVVKSLRTFWNDKLAISLGLSGLYLHRNLNLNSNNNNLANSNDNGRMARSYNMKTYNNLYEEIYSMNNLANSWRNARKGKIKKEYVLEFEKNIKHNLLNLRKLLLTQTYSLKPLKVFVLRDRKSTRLNSSHIPLYRMPSSAWKKKKKKNLKIQKNALKTPARRWR